MSKIKLKFIISTIFCSTFMSTMSGIAMKINQENKINMNDSLDLKGDEIDLTDEDKALIKKETEKLDEDFKALNNEIKKMGDNLNLENDKQQMSDDDLNLENEEVGNFL